MSQTIKRIYQPKLYFVLSFLIPGTLALLTGCNTKIEGCLDVAAANFDLNAERACNDCCTYPLISLSLSQKWYDGNFSVSDTLLDANGLPYKLWDLKYYLSSWSWIDSGHNTFSVDSTQIACSGGMLQYTPDIIQVDSRQYVYTLGTIRQSPSIDSVNLLVGLIPELDCVDAANTGTPPVLSDDSPLWDSGSSSRAAIRLVVQRDLTLETLDTIYIHAYQQLHIEYALDFKPGMPTTFNLSVNYADWFPQVDIQNLNSFETSILEGIQGSIFMTP